MTPPGRAVSQLDSLAPDQRAALELVVRRRRSYAELADLLGLPVEAVRARAQRALEALAPDLPPPPGAGELADFLLAQQDAEAQERTRARLASDGAAQSWVVTVGAPLAELMPAEARADDRPADARAVAAPAPEAAEPAQAPAATGRSSRLGGAILIAAAVAVVLIFVLTRGGSDKPTAAASPTPTATPTPADQLQPNDVVLRAPAGSKAVGLMRLFRTSDNNVHFLLAGQSLPPNRGSEHYALWFVKNGRPPRWLGYARFAVGKDGALAMTGPQKADLKRFPTWFATYDTVQVTDDGPGKASRPGTVILSGSLPHKGG
jgi:Sigma-70, region 4